MKAAILYELNKPLVIEEVEIPALLPGQVLVKIFYSGVCRSQLMEVKGGRGDDKFLPHMLGHEGSGEVVEIGEGVTKIKKGDKVILGWIKGSGKNVLGTQYKKGDTIINAGGVTTFSEYSVISENRCVKLPGGFPLDIAVLFGCAIPTGSGIVINTVKPKDDSSIAIFGLGGIGLSALMATNLYKCSKIIAIDINDDKLALAKEFGASHTINSNKEGPLVAISKLTGGVGVDYAVEAAGLTSTIEMAFSSVKNNGGICVFASHPRTGEKISIDPYDLICGKQIKGSWGGEVDPDVDIPQFIELYNKGLLPLDKLLSKRYKLEEINDALKDLETAKIARALIEINPI